MSSPKRIICWFRQDLRTSDNPTLYYAAKQGEILPIYILDDSNAGEHKMGAASRWWLHHSLTALDQSLHNKLSVYAGNPMDILSELIDRNNINAIYWNRCYEPWRIKRDKQIKEHLTNKGISVKSFNGSLLWEPWNITKEDGTPYKVFTPFYRRGCLKSEAPRKPLPTPPQLNLLKDKTNPPISSLNLLPSIRWDKQLVPHWQIGEAAAQKQLKSFLGNGIMHYKEGRNLPAKSYTSRLSPYLHFGEISPHQVWWTVQQLEPNDNTDHFCSELGWREFSYSLLYHNPTLPHENIHKKFNDFPWREDEHALSCWQKGQTGIPIIDAGMRELWQTGYMHNRVRMIVGSFLVKNLLLHWHHGERWFWDCLVDADLANNSASWQWIAGCGADAAPYFRIFNPVTQGQKFDPEGKYTRHYVPELKKLPNKYLFNPWEAPQNILTDAGIALGKTYPRPIVDLKTSRERALEAFRDISSTT